ncbi:hypothetical protein Fot_20993 [Forsythia ovata]|uniref:Uncharacterized protein n=1 Tax=Forsythia ovata TaxID=205694 RepID=A0ABD1UTR2_9LAMI
MAGSKMGGCDFCELGQEREPQIAEVPTSLHRSVKVQASELQMGKRREATIAPRAREKNLRMGLKGNGSRIWAGPFQMGLPILNLSFHCLCGSSSDVESSTPAMG